MASGHIRKRNWKNGANWQVVIDLGLDVKGNRQRIYKTVKGTKKDAEKLKTKLLHEIDTGSYKEPCEMTVEEYLQSWLKNYTTMLSPTTANGYRTNIEVHVIPVLGRIMLQKLSALDIQGFYNCLLETNHARTGKPLSTRTVEHIHANLKSALRKAIQMGLIDRNPMDAVVKPKVKEYRADVYTEDEVKRLLESTKDSWLEVPVLLGVGLGLRRGEVLALRWDCVDFGKSTIRVERSLIYVKGQISFKSPKSEAGERSLVVPASIMEVLRRHRTAQAKHRLKAGDLYADHDLVVCEPDGRPVVPSNLSNRFKAMLASAGFKILRFHDLRHTHASLLLKYGVAAKVASSRLGHSNVGITLDLYSHIYSEMEEDVAKKIDMNIFNAGAVCL